MVLSYLRLVDSIISRYEAEGESPGIAKYSAATSLTIFAALNVTTLLMLGRLLTGIELMEMMTNIGFNLAAICLLLGSHLYLGDLVQKRRARLSNGPELRNGPLWLRYVGVSAVGFVGALVTTLILR